LWKFGFTCSIQGMASAVDSNWNKSTDFRRNCCINYRCCSLLLLVEKNHTLELCWHSSLQNTLNFHCEDIIYVNNIRITYSNIHSEWMITTHTLHHIHRYYMTTTVTMVTVGPVCLHMTLVTKYNTKHMVCLLLWKVSLSIFNFQKEQELIVFLIHTLFSDFFTNDNFRIQIHCVQIWHVSTLQYEQCYCMDMLIVDESNVFMWCPSNCNIFTIFSVFHFIPHFSFQLSENKVCVVLGCVDVASYRMFCKIRIDVGRNPKNILHVWCEVNNNNNSTLTFTAFNWHTHNIHIYSCHVLCCVHGHVRCKFEIYVLWIWHRQHTYISFTHAHGLHITTNTITSLTCIYTNYNVRRVYNCVIYLYWLSIQHITNITHSHTYQTYITFKPQLTHSDHHTFKLTNRHVATVCAVNECDVCILTDTTTHNKHITLTYLSDIYYIHTTKKHKHITCTYKLTIMYVVCICVLLVCAWYIHIDWQYNT